MSSGGRSTPTHMRMTLRSTARVDHKSVLETYHEGDTTRYTQALVHEAQEAKEHLKAVRESIESRCAAYSRAEFIPQGWPDQLYKDLDTLDTSLAAYADCVNDCIGFTNYRKDLENDNKKKTIEAYQGKLNEQRNAVTTLSVKVRDAIARLEATLAKYHAETPSVRAAGTRPRNNAAATPATAADEDIGIYEKHVKPKVLSSNATPSDYSDWKDDLVAYIECAKLLGANKNVQQRVVRSFMDGELRSKLKGSVDNNTPIFGDDPEDINTGAKPGSMIYHLNKEFQAAYPIMSRQMSLFKGRQAQGQEWLAFLRKNDEIKRNAAFEGLTFDDIYVIVLMAQTSDNALLERFQRLPKTDRGSGQMLPTYLQLKEEATQYASDRKIRKDFNGDSTPPVPSSRAAEAGGDRNKRHFGGNKDNWVRDHYIKLKSLGLCCRCGDKFSENHSSSCKGKNGKCVYCKKKGHLATACSKKAKDGPKARQAEATADSQSQQSDGDNSEATSEDDDYFEDGTPRYHEDGTPVARTCEVIPAGDEPIIRSCDAGTDSDSDSDDEDNMSESAWMDEYFIDPESDTDPDIDYIFDHKNRALQLQTEPTALTKSQKRRRRRRKVQQGRERVHEIIERPDHLSASTERRTVATNSPLANAIQAAKNIPKNVPVPVFDITFRQHRYKGEWHNVSAIPDTGANRSIFNANMLQRCGIRIDTTERERVRLASSSGIMPSVGHVQLRVKSRDDNNRDHIIIDAIASPTLKEEALISFNDLRRLGVISDDFPRRHSQLPTVRNLRASDHETALQHIINKYPEVFDEDNLAPLKIKPMQINVNEDDPNYDPLRCYTARKTPLHFEEEADKLLKYLLDNGVISRADPNKAYTWVSPAFFVPKSSGKARLVIDFSRLSKFTSRTPHPFPSPRDVVRGIKSTSKWFLTADAKNGYFQIALSNKSREYTAFLLPQGLFIMNRGPQGLSATSDNFVAATDSILEGVEQIKIVDDILIQGQTPEECLVIFEEVCKRSQKFGLTLTKDKVRLAQEVSFAGFIISNKGIKADPYKLAALAEFPTPRNLRDLRSFCGAINQLNMLNPDIAHAMADLRPLLKTKNSFLWTTYHENIFRKVRALVSREMRIRPFDRNLPVRLVCDASRLNGLGYALCNVETFERANDDGEKKTEERLHIVQCNSRVLSPAETRYATNELECSVVAWAVTDCRFYLYGMKNFEVHTDHRALEHIFRQPLSDVVNQRMLRLREKIMDYSFTVKWQPGSKMQLADALSRRPLFAAPEKAIAEENESALVNMIAADPMLQDIYDAAETDAEYQTLVTAIKQGTPYKKLPDDHYGKQFAMQYDNLSIHDVLLAYNDSRIIVPAAARPAALQQAHAAHTGIDRCLKRARKSFYWPGMKNEVTQMINDCEPCQIYRDSQPEEEIKPFPPTTEPMQLVGTDLFSYAGHQHCLMADAFTGMIFVKRLKRETSSAIIHVLDSWFRLLGLPQVILSDNGPCYGSDTFREYCEANHIRHVTSSPGHPRSNGLSEANVSSAKLLLKRCTTYEVFEKKLLELNSTPRHGENASPAELFFGRTIRANMPVLANVYNPEEGDNDTTPAFKIGDRVRVQDLITETWEKKGTVIRIRPLGRSFEVMMDEGGVRTRNRRFIKLLSQAHQDSFIKLLSSRAQDFLPREAHSGTSDDAAATKDKDQPRAESPAQSGVESRADNNLPPPQLQAGGSPGELEGDRRQDRHQERAPPVRRSKRLHRQRTIHDV